MNFQLDRIDKNSLRYDVEIAKLIKERVTREINIEIDDEEVSKFVIYLQELDKWNSLINLTSIRGLEEIVERHFVDSLILLKYFDVESQKLIDVGSGAGFPGIPIKICRPKIRLTLLESIGKKARFLEYVTDVLELVDVTVINKRAEELARMSEHREQYDIALARYVANLSTLVEYCLPLVVIGGKFVAYKDDRVEPELRSSENAIATLGGRISRVVKAGSAGSETGKHERVLVFIDKVQGTPYEYPRRLGIARKKPIR